MKFFTTIWIIIAILIPNSILAEDIKPEILDKTRKAIVSIDIRISVSAYGVTGNASGTGFIADKANGLIVTNAHIANPASVGSYFVTFFNGKQSEAKVIYCDGWQDYALMKIDPKDIPSDTTEIIFSKTEPKQNQNVFIIGNNEAQDFSFHAGHLSNLYDISGSMPQQTYVINLNARGGSSGSPLLNDNGEAIGVHYGASDTYGLSLKGEYVTHSLEAIKKGIVPSRKHMGIITSTYSLDKAVNHRNFPKNIMEDYIKKYPDARNKVIQVIQALKNSPAEALLQTGDIIWQINGADVTASLFTLDNAMNLSKDNKVQLVIYRNGKKIDLDVPLYDVDSHQVKTLVEFAGATIFEADDFTSAKSGIPLGTVAIVNIKQGSALSANPLFLNLGQGHPATWRMYIDELDNNPVKDLKSLIDLLPAVVSKKFVTMRVTNHQPYFEFFDGIMQTAHRNAVIDITLDALDAKPRIMKFQNQTGEWNIETLVSEDNYHN